MKKEERYWNELLDKLSRGVITDEERFELEKQALDDPFLFDAIEGYTLHGKTADETKVGGETKTGRILTLPRMAAAASLIFLVSMIWLMKGDRQEPGPADQSMAMVLEETKEDQVSTVSDVEDTDGESIVAKTKDEQETNQKSKQKKRTIPNKQNDLEVEVYTYENAKEKVIVTAEEEPAASVPAAQSEMVIEDAETTFDIADSDNGLTADGSNSFESIPAKKRVEAGANLFLAAEPEIGRKDFDAYALDIIKKRGLQQDSTIQIIIEFTVLADGTPTDFTHIVEGEDHCPTCAALAMAIMQRSGLWRTKSDLVQGRSRYTFDF